MVENSHRRFDGKLPNQTPWGGRAQTLLMIWLCEKIAFSICIFRDGSDTWHLSSKVESKNPVVYFHKRVISDTSANSMLKKTKVVKSVSELNAPESDFAATSKNPPHYLLWREYCNRKHAKTSSCENSGEDLYTRVRSHGEIANLNAFKSEPATGTESHLLVLLFHENIIFVVVLQSSKTLSCEV